jgi:hypothetical protein
MTHKNLILCTAWGYEASQVAIFVESWKKHMRDYSNMTMVIEPFASNKKLNYLEKSGIDIRFYTAASFIPSSINNTRYFKYLDILLENKEHERVFLCDVFDVAFQGDIFKEIAAPKNSSTDLFVNKEDHRYNLTEKYNQAWLENNYGKEVAESLSKKCILCSGTTLGSKEMIKNYINKLIQQRDLAKMMRAGGEPDEQAVYNYIFHNNLIEHFQLDNGFGVGTLSLCPSEDLKLIKEKVLVGNKTPSVIHQWNRTSNREPYLTSYYTNIYLNGDYSASHLVD